MNMSVVDYWFGVAYSDTGNSQSANYHLERAARMRTDFQQMQIREISETTFWSAMALARLGRQNESEALARQIQQYAGELEKQEPKIDYFATSLPAMLLFDEDLHERQTITVLFLQAQAVLALGEDKKTLGLDLLRQVLQRDRNHIGAIDLLRQFQR